jgi:ubiquinone/menaquinone biosynthesis C-methylase UbiE
VARILTHAQAKAFYDRFGARLEAPMAYEAAPIDELVAHIDAGHARAVCEFGCGTGRLAERLLSDELPDSCSYLGLDISETMVALARRRLEKVGSRSSVVLSDGSMRLPAEAGAFDRIISAYVLDLLGLDDIAALVTEAHRCLVPGGFLGVVSLTFGEAPAQRVAIGAWRIVHWLRPQLVGGCRPLRLSGFLAPDRWRIRYRAVVSQSAIPSEVLVAERL